MDKIEYQTIASYVGQSMEFDYLKALSKDYNINYMSMVDYALDYYNYQRRNGLDKTGAKIMTLTRCFDRCQEMYSNGK